MVLPVVACCEAVQEEVKSLLWPASAREAKLKMGTCMDVCCCLLPCDNNHNNTNAPLQQPLVPCSLLRDCETVHLTTPAPIPKPVELSFTIRASAYMQRARQPQATPTHHHSLTCDRFHLILHSTSTSPRDAYELT
jgi:hypothetical protein